MAIQRSQYDEETSRTPFFILANPRSGSSLLRLMLNSHELITVPPECGFAVWLKKSCENLDLSQPEILRSFARDLYNSRKFETWEISADKVLEKIMNREYRRYSELVLRIYELYAEVKGKKPLIYGDKNNFYVNHIEEISEIFPDAKFIHLIRDGRDVAASFAELDRRQIVSKYAPPAGRDIQSIAIEWVANNVEVSRHTNSSFLKIHYEDLVTFPIQTIGIICDFLRLPYSNNIELFFLHNDEPKEFLQWKERTTGGVVGTQVSRYKNELSASDITQFMAIGGPLLKHFGYDS